MVEFDLKWERLPIAELQQLDAVCSRFEASLSVSPETRIEAFVVGLTEPQQRLVVRELVQLELEDRYARGQRPMANEYSQRFPLWADEMCALAAERIAGLERAESAVRIADTIEQREATPNDTQLELSPCPPPSTVAGVSDPSWGDQCRRGLWGQLLSLPDDGVLGHYLLQRVIGRGGMGVVIRARDTQLARDVAIKLLLPEIARDPKTNARVLREARAAGVVRHRNVATIYAVEEIEGLSFLVMELVDGTTLEEYLRARGKLPAGEVVILACQIAQGLAAAHKHGLIHCDVKPSNILLEKVDQDESNPLSNWQVKICDFGLARVAAEVRLTSSGWIAGTPQYMSPEQACGQAIDARSDLFSLGSVMYAMCAGRAAFEAESAIGTLRLVADKPARPLQEVSHDTPDWLAAIIEKLMAKSPDERFQSAPEVASLLRAIAR